MSGTRRKPGALGPHVEGFRSYLLERGYTSGTVRGQLKVMGQLGRWMETRGLCPTELRAEDIEAFVAEVGADQDGHRADRRTLLRLLDHLVDERVVSAPQPTSATALESLLSDYREWMLSERGLADATVLRYERTARRFLAQREGDGDGSTGTGLTGVEVNAFLLAECGRCSVGAAKGRVAELRSLLRFLYLRGLTSSALATAVPPVAGWHNTGIPPTVSPDDVQALLDSCDRTVAVGIRDFAIIILVARLALRSIEVARMELDDVSWRTGEITIRGKARRHDPMPLPAEVGKELATYLVDARPAVRPEQRRLFLTCRAPLAPIRADLVGDVVKRACRRAGLPTVGPHRLRHGLASQLLSKGVALSDISQVLRHRDLATTAIYAKVDLDSLRMVARPWPHVGPVRAGAER